MFVSEGGEECDFVACVDDGVCGEAGVCAGDVDGVPGAGAEGGGGGVCFCACGVVGCAECVVLVVGGFSVGFV